MDLLQNPFHILTASPRDNRRRIMELTEERSLQGDSSKCMQACSDLTNPRKRLSAEVAWLPGIGPKQTAELITSLDTKVTDILTVRNLPSLSRANLLASALSRVPDYKIDDVTEWILSIAWTFEDVVPEKVCSVINEERVVSGFPEITDLSVVESEIQERRLHYRNIVKSALDNLSSEDLVAVVTRVVESATNGGEELGPILIADLVDAYEVEAQGFLEGEEKNIRILIEGIRSALESKQPDSVLDPMVSKLIHVVKNWDTVAQPIQVSTKSRGLDHDASHRVARLIRDLAVYMFNEHSKLDLSQRLTTTLQEVFAEVGEVAEKIAEDADALEEIAEGRKLSLLLEPISDLCKTALENADKNPASADKEAQKVMNLGPRLVSDLVELRPTADILSEGKEIIAITLMHCAVAYGNETEKWKPCITFLEEAMKYASGNELKEKIINNLETVKNNERLYGNLRPITSAPSLGTANGTGTTLYGASDYDKGTGSYISTYYIVIFGIPIFPIRRYRVIPIPGGYRFLGKMPLRTFDKWHIAVSIGIMIGLIWYFTKDAG